MHSLIWPRGVCAPEQGIVIRVFSLKQDPQFHYLTSWTGCFFVSEAFKRVWMELTVSGLYMWCHIFQFCVPQSLKTKETNPTRPGPPLHVNRPLDGVAK